uniref:Cytochrome c oxidase subunit 3 n=1 Tax=Cheiracanthium brevispinum TaxID=2773961 RepID=A0AA51VHZ0_9ARAC|nr:cytochrome c oxidase subunit III [Cheiracanthium brevispinum]WMX19911.1 cytochrome c oxidase subunit III [Cheiracanthium brevispinum]
MEKFFHPYHMVNMSPWPLLAGFGALGVMMSMIKMFSFFEANMFFMSITMMVFVSMFWWRDVIRESTYQGNHSSMVLSGLMIGMILFIVSEVFFFISFFWAFFHSSLSPSMELGILWPPCGLIAFNPFQVPLLNTVILLASGVSITWCHQSLLNNNFIIAKKSLMLTWMLGLYFLMLQWFEYSMASFSISDSVYGSIFFMATGFHGFHVIVGTLFLFTMWLRMLKSEMSSYHHFGFEAAAWYWHFVDVVWLFLFSVVYWWGM